jgi:hypothetical protein
MKECLPEETAKTLVRPSHPSRPSHRPIRPIRPSYLRRQPSDSMPHGYRMRFGSRRLDL